MKALGFPALYQDCRLLLKPVTALGCGIWISFFDTEEAHAVMRAHAANGGGRAALKVPPISLNL